jgi:D-beta-D-heptose 7-phosphate kinase/D-beta-D-heptose 1-phosphate adenosyltransferase
MTSLNPAHDPASPPGGLTATQLSELVRRLGSPRVLVIGDIILDRYVFGAAERISQEAPVPVFRVDREEDRLGGAASVASMLIALGAHVTLAGVVGSDDAATRVRRLLGDFGLGTQAVLEDTGRRTTLKIRFIGRAQDRHPQQMMRADYEERHPLDAPLEDRLIAAIERQLDRCDIVLVSDYAKGVCSPKLLKRVIDLARARKLRVIVDPIRGSDYSRYAGASCLTPNRTETHLATGMPVQNSAEAIAAGAHLREQLGCEAMVVTLDKDGMALVHADGRGKVLPTRARQVYDITGAGDMVLSVLGLCLAAGEDYEAAVALGNIAGGLEVEHLGVATLSRADLLRDLATTSATTTAKLLSREALLEALAPRRQAGERVVFTNGCFDILHAGHVRLLRQARELGHLLVVGLNADDSIRRIKGANRPVNPVDARTEVLAGLGCVDYVVVFHEDSSLPLIEAVRPDILVKGGDYRIDQVVGRDFVESYGGQVALVPLTPDQSTSRILRMIGEE